MPGTVEAPPGSQYAGDEVEAPQLHGLNLIRLLARGGFAEVWEAEQVSLGRRVAVKILRYEHLGQEQMVALFDQEAHVLARLNHPNVVQVIDKGNSSRGPYFVMEYVEGETLQELLSRGRLSRDRALSILLQAAKGLAYAHRNRVVHRDVKPANILVSRQGQVKIGDFGIAAVRAAAGEKEDTDPGPSTALGTRAFMAPEQRISFNAVGPAADTYSLGVILHRIITGRLPQAPGVPAAGVEIPDALRPIVLQSLAPTAATRYKDAGAFRDALVNALEGRHIEARVKRGATTALGQGRFELLDVLRQDAQRSVYLVRKGGPGGEQVVVKRYLRDVEALRTVRALARLAHPNIVRIHAVGERDGSFMMLLDHLAGGDLRERLVQPHPWREVARVGCEVAKALAYAAEHGIVHGNLRPSNILFDEKGAVKVTDFGLPEHYRGVPGMRNWYAAPEDERGEPGDLYALGAILYEMLLATPPPERALEPLGEGARRGDFPEDFATILRRLLAPAAERYARAADIARDLGRLLEAAGPAEAAARETLQAPEAALAAARAVTSPRAAFAHGPALLGLAGLIFIFLLERRAVQDFIVNWVASLR